MSTLKADTWASRGSIRFDEAAEVVAAVESAGDLGILEMLEASPCRAAEVAVGLDLDPRMTELLLEVLDIAGAVERDDGGVYRGRLPAGLLALQGNIWSQLTAAVRSGRSVLDVSDPAVAGASYPHVVEHLVGLSDGARSEVIGALASCGSPVLDLGAGAAPWSRAIAALDPEVEVIAVDLPDVIGVTERVVADAGLTDRFRFVTGDLFTVDVGTDFGLVLLAGVCRLFGAEQNARLARRLASVVRPGGTIAILDALPDIDRADGRRIGLYALSLALRTNQGAVHPFSSYASWLYNAGFREIELSMLSTPELSLIKATRPH